MTARRLPAAGATLVAIAQLVACSGDGAGDVAQRWTGEKLISSDRETYDYFGDAVAVSADGSTVVVGAPHVGLGLGAVYVLGWDGSGWSESRLEASDGAEYDEFGVSVAVSADGATVLAGSVAGAAHVLAWDGAAWSETRLADPAAGTEAASTDFGTTVALSPDGTVAVVGSWPGSTCVFERDGAGWALQATLNTAAKAYATSISSDADTIVQGWAESSAVAVYERDGETWTETLLEPSDGVTGDDFGWSVSTAAGGDVIVVGAPGYRVPAAVYAFSREGEGWAEQKVLAAKELDDTLFGRSVAAAEDGTIVIGGTIAERAYVFRPTGGGWVQAARLTPTDGFVDAAYGARAAISSDGSTIVIGAPEYWTNVGPNEGGSVHVYRRQD